MRLIGAFQSVGGYHRYISGTQNADRCRTGDLPEHDQCTRPKQIAASLRHAVGWSPMLTSKPGKPRWQYWSSVVLVTESLDRITDRRRTIWHAQISCGTKCRNERAIQGLWKMIKMIEARDTIDEASPIPPGPKLVGCRFCA